MNAKFADKVFRVFFVLALVLGNVWTPGTQAKARNATDFVPHTISTWQDEYGRWWVENDYYRIELTEFSSFAVKSGEDEREWRIYTTWPWIGSHAVTFSGQSYRLLYGGESPVVVELLEQTSDHVIFRVTSTASGDGSPIVLHNTLFFLVNSPAIRVDSELLGDTISSRFEAVTYNLFLSAGGDISNDWYTWPGGDRYPFPYDYWRTIYGPEFAPIDNQIYIAAYDTAVLQGMALIGNYNDTTEFTTDMTYGRASVEGAIGYFDPDILLSMIAGRKTSFFIYPFDVDDPNPVSEIESFIQILSSNQPPTADAGGPYTGIAGDSITLDASASSDPEAGALTYEWDLDNDSEYDDATGVTTTTVFNQAGEYTVGLRVTEPLGLTSTDTATVTITNPPEPGAFDKSSPSDGAADVPASLTLSWNTSSGAASYEYCYDTTDNNTCDDFWISTDENTSAELSSLSSSTIYYWQARAINAGGATYADNNTWWSFTTMFIDPSQSGPTFIVNSTASTNDGICSVANCTLREAINAANADEVPSIVELEPNATYVLTEVDNYGDRGWNGLPVISTELTINGHYATLERSTDEGVPSFRFILSYGPLILNDVTLSGGSSNGDGGAILSTGSLNIVNSSIIDNKALGAGGGIQSEGGSLEVINSRFENNSTPYYGGAILNGGSSILTVSNSTFRNNKADSHGGAIISYSSLTVTDSVFDSNISDNGGGIANANDGITIISDTTFSDNQAGWGGGIWNSIGIVTISNSTFMSNSAGSGGAINSGGTVNLSNSTFFGNNATAGGAITNYYDANNGYMGILNVTNSTFSNNSAQNTGGAIHNYAGGPATIKNSIFADSVSAENCFGIESDGGHNLDAGTSCGFSSANGSLNNANPRLGPLQDNGGRTWTMALEPGSPAIDAGDNATCSDSPINTLDQRGMARPFDGDNDGNATCDIGSYENQSPPPDFIYIDTNLPGVFESSTVWGDYDNDDDLDILLSGNTAYYSDRIAAVYRNNGDGSFTDIEAGLPGVDISSSAWGDYDNDGHLDFVLTGRSDQYGLLTQVYHNNGHDTFTDINAGLPGVYYGSPAWGDYDNDGDLDLLLTGSSNELISRIYRNDHGNFVDINAGLTGVSIGVGIWGDYDNDGYLDILLAGYQGPSDSGEYTSKVYHNNKDGTFTEINAGLMAGSSGRAAWGDYNNDGRLDIILAGLSTSLFWFVRVYRNEGNGAFTEIDPGIPVGEMWSIAWGDYDNDGKLDILLAGSSTSVYRNNGDETFADINANLPGAPYGSGVWGDYDNDGRLDILMSYMAYPGAVTRIYRNNSEISNASPGMPSHLSALVENGTVTLQWNPASDNETPVNGLTYNLRIGTTPGGGDVLAPMANIGDGYRRVSALGNAQHNTTKTFTLPGGTYYWSVQAVDTAFAGSSFASEGSFFVPIPGVFGKTSPANNSTGESLTPTISWGDSSNADGYEYCINTTDNDVCETGWTSSDGSTSISLGGLNEGTTYYWQVRAINEDGTTYADNGTWWTFTTRTPPVQLNASFAGHLPGNQVHAYNWMAGTTLTLTIDDPDISGSPDFQGTEIVPDNDPYGSTWTVFELPNFELKPGQAMTITDGTTTRTHVVRTVAVAFVDSDNDIISGTAEPNTEVGINAHYAPDGDYVHRSISTDENGNWTVNLSIAGLNPGEEQTYDIVSGSWGTAFQWDQDNDSTFYAWRGYAPRMDVGVPNDFICAHDWPEGSVLTLTIDDTDNGIGIDLTRSETVSPWPDDPNEFAACFDLRDQFNIQPGDEITITGGGYTKVHLARYLTITELNPNADTVSGAADAGTEVRVWLNSGADWIFRSETADSNGAWAANYGIPGDSASEETVFDLQPNTQGHARIEDEDSDATQENWRVPNPSISVRMLEKRVQAYGWLLGSSVTLYLDDPNIPGSPDYTDTQTVGVANWDPNSTLVEFQVSDEIALKPGLLVTMTDGGIVKTHTATNLVVTGVDPENDTVFGTAQPGSFVHVGHLCENNLCAFRYVTVDENGNWIADFAHPGEDSNEQDLFDIRPGTNNEARQHDSDGDATQYGWRVPNPQITVGTEWDAVFGHDWPLGATVYLAIDDPSTGPGLDYSDSQVVTGEPLNTRLDFNLRGFDVQPSHIVTFTHDTFSKELVVSHMKITDIDADLDLVFGTADPVGEIQIDVRQSGGGPPSSQTLYLTADQNGDWIADFAGVWDITTDHEVFAHEVDGDDDVTMDIHGFPNPTFSARLTDNEVHGYEWPLGASVTLRIDDPNTPEPIDYTKTQTANISDWDPNQTFVQFRLGEESFTLVHGMTVSMSDGITTKTHVVTSLTVTDIDIDADTISGTASPGTQVDIGHIYCDDNGCSGFRRVFAESNGDWIADFAHAGEDDDEQDIIDITAGMGSEARECDEDWDCTQHGWYVFAYTLHAVPAHPEVHGHDWPWGAEVTLTVDDDTDPNNGTRYTQTKNADDDPWCGYPCFDLNGVFDLQVGQYVTMTDGTVTRTVQVSTLQITSVDMENETLSGIADPGSDVMVNIWSQDGKARHTVADSNGDWAVDFSVFGDEDFEQFTTDIGYGDDGRAIQLNPDGTDDGTLEYWNQDWVAPDTIPLVVAMPFSPSLDRVEYTLEAWTLYNLLWEPLFRTTGQGTPVPAAASEYTVSTDGLVYTITLQDGLLWSDGQPVTAQHYVDGLLRILSPESVDGFGSLLYDVQGAEDFSTGVTNDPNDLGLRALNAQTLQITLAHPAVYFLQILADPGMAPARLDLIGQHGDAWIAPENFVGNGPYTLTEYDSGHLLLQKNLQFHDAASVSIGQIAFDIIEDENERFEAYKRGDMDVLMDAPQSALDDPNFDQERVYSASPGVFYIGLNTQRAPTDNPLVRKALASAIDRRTLLDTVFNTPWLQEATGIIPPELQGYQGEAVGYEYNPAYAQGLLAVAGYPGGAGLPTVHMYGNDTLWDRTIMEAVADQWRDVLNISVETHYTEDFRSWISNCENDTGACDYNAFRAGWYIDYYDPHNIINDLFNPDTSFARRTGWDDARYRELIELSREETDPAQRVAYLQEAEQILVEDDVAVIPLYFLERVSLIKPGFQPAFGIVPYFDQWNMLADTDGDGIEDLADNAPTIYNPDQRDVDNDGIADVLDSCPDDSANTCNTSGSGASVIGSSGGILTTPNSMAALNIPANAVSDDISFSITDTGGGYQVTISEGTMTILHSYIIQPHGMQFDPPATVIFRWDDADNDGIVDGTTLHESHFLLIKDGLVITPSCVVNPSCDMNANELAVEVSGLSLFELAIPSNQPPTANAGPDINAYVGVIITLNASASSDPEAGSLTYEWDLDNDGQYDDASGVTAITSFNQRGDHTIGLRVTDEGGLSDTDTATITILPWTLKGFYQPVDMNGVYNLVKGGSTVPLKFEIFAGATELTDIADIKSLTYAQTSCDATATTDEIEAIVTGGTSLRYDTAAGQFIYNWKTPKSAGKCYRVTMTTIDNSSLVAYFRFK